MILQTKDRITGLLRKAQSGGFLSGEEISRQLGISRAAVSQAVRSLREDGYTISSVTNRGYRMEDGAEDFCAGTPAEACPFDPLTPGELAAYIEEERLDRVQCFEEIDSTNSELIRQAASGAPDGTVLVADMQTGGRGRRGRSFASPSGMGVYLSYLIRPSSSLKEKIAAEGDAGLWASLTSWTSVAAAAAVAECCGSWPDIKWVNDLYKNGRKLCGILTQIQMATENYEVESIVIGMGVNVHQRYEDFPEEIREIAGSLRTEFDVPVRRAALAAALIRSLDRMYAAWPDARGEYLRLYREHSLVIGRAVTLSDIHQKAEPAFVLGVDDDFALHVRMEDGSERHLISGDISLRLA